jgi:hypothetical protein
VLELDAARLLEGDGLERVVVRQRRARAAS